MQTERDISTGDGSVSSRVSKSPPATVSQPVGEPTTGENADSVLEFYYPGYPERLIIITQEWAQYLDPKVESANRSVFDLIMQERDDV